MCSSLCVMLFRSLDKDDDTSKINESNCPVMNSTFQNDELRNTLKETVSEVLNDTGVLNGVRFLMIYGAIVNVFISKMKLKLI